MNWWVLLFLAICSLYLVLDLSSPPISIWGALFPLSILFGIGVYSSTKERKPTIFEKYQVNRNVILTTNLLFLILLLLANINLKSSLYERSYAFFIIIALAFGINAIEIKFINKENRFLIFLNLLKTYILGLNLRLSARFLSSVPLQSDIWFHDYRIVVPIINNGFLPDLVYKNWPFMHLYLAISRMISGIDMYSSHFIFMGLIPALGIIAIFLLVRERLGIKHALITSLVYASLNYTILETQAPIPSSLGVFLFILTVLSLFRSKYDTRYTIISILGLVSMVILHALVPFVLAILLAVSISFDKISNIFARKKEIFSFSIIGVFFIILLLTYWFYATKGWYEGILFTVKRALLTSRVHVYSWGDQVKPMLTYIGNIDEAVLLFFGAITICFWGDPRAKKSDFRTFVILSFLTSSVIFLMTVIGSETLLPQVITQSKLILPERWHPYLDVFASIMISVVFVKFLLKRPAAIFAILVLFVIFETVYIAPELVWFGRESKRQLFIYKDSEYYPLEIFEKKIRERTYTETWVGLFLDFEPFIALNSTKDVIENPTILNKQVEEIGISILRGTDDPLTGYSGVTLPFDMSDIEFKDIIFTNGQVLYFY